MSQQRFHDPMPRFPPRGPLGRLFPRFRGTTKALRLPAVPPAALRCLRLAVPRERTALFVPPDAAARKRRAWGWSPGIPVRAYFRGNDRISQVSGEPQFPSAHVLGPRTASTPQTITERSRGPPPQKREGAVVQQNFEAGYSMAFGSPPTYHKYRLPSTGKAGFQVLVRLSCTGFPPAGLLQKVSNSRHVCFPPFPGFLTQFCAFAASRLCVNPLPENE